MHWGLSPLLLGMQSPAETALGKAAGLAMGVKPWQGGAQL